MQLAMVDAAYRHDELVAHSPSERARLGKGQVVRIRWDAAACPGGAMKPLLSPEFGRPSPAQYGHPRIAAPKPFSTSALGKTVRQRRPLPMQLLIVQGRRSHSVGKLSMQLLIVPRRRGHSAG